MEHISRFIAGKSFCPFGDAAVWGLQSNLAKFRGEFITLIDQTNPEDIGPNIPIRPIYRPDTGEASGLHDSTMLPVGEPLLNREKIIGD
jgi:NADH-quinone oxidoreductase subunit F